MLSSIKSRVSISHNEYANYKRVNMTCHKATQSYDVSYCRTPKTLSINVSSFYNSKLQNLAKPIHANEYIEQVQLALRHHDRQFRLGKVELAEKMTINIFVNKIIEYGDEKIILPDPVFNESLLTESERIFNCFDSLASIRAMNANVNIVTAALEHIKNKSFERLFKNKSISPGLYFHLDVYAGYISYDEAISVFANRADNEDPNTLD